MAYTSNLDFGPYGQYGTYQIKTTPVKGDSTMPWAAIIPAAASVAGAVIGSRASSKATEASSKANQQALSYQMAQEARRKAEYDKAVELHKQQWEAWDAIRDALLQRYGVDIAPPSETKPAMPATVGTAAAPGVTNGGVGSFMRAPVVAPVEATPTTMPAPQGRTLGSMMPGAQPSLSSWNDWSRYKLA